MPKSIPRLIIALLLATTLFSARAGEHGVIVLYHHVAEDTPPSTSISPADFRRHLEYLRDNNFNVMALDQMLESLRNQQEIPDKSIAITFDDGYSSIYEEAFPMLKSFGFPFALFLSTQPVDDQQPGYMSWDQVSEMSDSGVIVANHMVHHPYMLDRLESESRNAWLQRLRIELLQAERQIAERTGQSHKYLAYPYGEFDPDIKAMLADEGFTGLAQNSGAVGFHSDFLALPRYPLASIYANLDTARAKFDSLAFQVLEQIPDTPVTESNSPSVRIRFASGDYLFDQISCFADSRPIPMTWLDKSAGLLELAPDQQFNGRRWRYICTAPLPGSSRYFWHSVQWIRAD